MGKSEQATNDSNSIEVLNSKSSSEREKQKAFNNLFSTHQKQLLMYFLKRLNGDGETADDLLMTTFEKIHNHIASYNTKYAFSTWMYKIAERTLIDHLRKSKYEVLSLHSLNTKTSEGNEGAEFQLDSGAMNPEEALVNNEDIAMVTNAIGSLENDFIRELMTCRYIDDLSFEETAQKMGVKNNSTLRVNIHRGVDIIKQQLFSQK